MEQNKPNKQHISLKYAPTHISDTMSKIEF